MGFFDKIFKKKQEPSQGKMVDHSKEAEEEKKKKEEEEKKEGEGGAAASTEEKKEDDAPAAASTDSAAAAAGEGVAATTDNTADPPPADAAPPPAPTNDDSAAAESGSAVAGALASPQTIATPSEQQSVPPTPNEGGPATNPATPAGDGAAPPPAVTVTQPQQTGSDSQQQQSHQEPQPTPPQQGAVGGQGPPGPPQQPHGGPGAGAGQPPGHFHHPPGIPGRGPPPPRGPPPGGLSRQPSQYRSPSQGSNLSHAGPGGGGPPGGFPPGRGPPPPNGPPPGGAGGQHFQQNQNVMGGGPPPGGNPPPFRGPPPGAVPLPGMARPGGPAPPPAGAGGVPPSPRDNLNGSTTLTNASFGRMPPNMRPHHHHHHQHQHHQGHHQHHQHHQHLQHHHHHHQQMHPPGQQRSGSQGQAPPGQQPHQQQQQQQQPAAPQQPPTPASNESSVVASPPTQLEGTQNGPGTATSASTAAVSHTNENPAATQPTSEGAGQSSDAVSATPTTSEQTGGGLVTEKQVTTVLSEMTNDAPPNEREDENNTAVANNSEATTSSPKKTTPTKAADSDDDSDGPSFDEESVDFEEKNDESSSEAAVPAGSGKSSPVSPAAPQKKNEEEGSTAASQPSSPAVGKRQGSLRMTSPREKEVKSMRQPSMASVASEKQQAESEAGGPPESLSTPKAESLAQSGKGSVPPAAKVGTPGSAKLRRLQQPKTPITTTSQRNEAPTEASGTPLLQQPTFDAATADQKHSATLEIERVKPSSTAKKVFLQRFAKILNQHQYYGRIDKLRNLMFINPKSNNPKSLNSLATAGGRGGGGMDSTVLLAVPTTVALTPNQLDLNHTIFYPQVLLEPETAAPLPRDKGTAAAGESSMISAASPSSAMRARTNSDAGDSQVVTHFMVFEGATGRMLFAQSELEARRKLEYGDSVFVTNQSGLLIRSPQQLLPVAELDVVWTPSNKVENASCPKHRCPLQLYNPDRKELCCALCYANSPFHEHLVVLDDVLSTEKNGGRSLLGMLEERRDYISDVVRQGVHLHSQIANAGDKKRAAIETQLDLVVAAVNAKKKQLLEEVTIEERDAQSKLTADLLTAQEHSRHATAAIDTLKRAGGNPTLLELSTVASARAFDRVEVPRGRPDPLSNMSVSVEGLVERVHSLAFKEDRSLNRSSGPYSHHSQQSSHHRHHQQQQHGGFDSDSAAADLSAGESGFIKRQRDMDESALDRTDPFRGRTPVRGRTRGVRFQGKESHLHNNGNKTPSRRASSAVGASASKLSAMNSSRVSSASRSRKNNARTPSGNRGGNSVSRSTAKRPVSASSRRHDANATDTDYSTFDEYEGEGGQGGQGGSPSKWSSAQRGGAGRTGGNGSGGIVAPSGALSHMVDGTCVFNAPLVPLITPRKTVEWRLRIDDHGDWVGVGVAVGSDIQSLSSGETMDTKHLWVAPVHFPRILRLRVNTGPNGVAKLTVHDNHGKQLDDGRIPHWSIFKSSFPQVSFGKVKGKVTMLEPPKQTIVSTIRR